MPGGPHFDGGNSERIGKQAETVERPASLQVRVGDRQWSRTRYPRKSPDVGVYENGAGEESGHDNPPRGRDSPECDPCRSEQRYRDQDAKRKDESPDGGATRKAFHG